jgi:YHS domain-containing protein
VNEPAPRRCAICKEALAASALRVRYEGQVYEFDRERCKRIFQENPDRWLDAHGGVLEHPR